MKYGIGDTGYPDGCTRAYQLANPLIINFVKEEQIPVECDGEIEVISYLSVSENGWSWFPITAVTRDIEQGE